MPKELADVLREAVRGSGLTALAIAKATGVPQPTITEFLRGRDIRMSRGGKIAAFLGLELREVTKRKK